jgi:acyl dehydratase
VEVTLRSALAYAAAIGQTGDCTFDDARDLIVVPQFCVTLEWLVVTGGRRQELLGLTADEARQVVHVEQDSQFHRGIQPGDRVRVRGRVLQIRSTRAGAFVGMRLTTVDMKDESAITTSWYGVIYRGVAVEGDGGTIDDASHWPPLTETFDRTIDIAVPRGAAHVYTECSGIWNPIHTERRAALAAGLPDIILHGTATWALAGRELVRAYAAGNPATLRRLRARFAAPVIPGQPIALLHRAVSTDQVHFVVRSVDGRLAVTDGRAVFDTRS